MALLAGKIYRASDVASVVADSAVFVAEQFNHRVSKWVYVPGATSPDNFIFNIDAGRITAITVNTGGTMYTVGDPIIITPPTNPLVAGVTATAEVLTVGVDPFPIATIRITNQGSGYETGSPPTANAPTAGTLATFNAIVPTTIWGPNGDGTTGQAGPIGAGDSTDNSLYRPTGIIFDGTRLVVTDTFHNRIRTINTTTGAFIGSAGSGGFGDNNFYHPAGIAIDGSSGIIVIADELNHRALRYLRDTTPTFVSVLQDPSFFGSALSFVRPHGVVFNSNSDTFNVADSARGLFTGYQNPPSTVAGQFGTPGSTGHVPAANGTELFFPSSGHGLLTGTSLSTFADTRNNSLKTETGSTIAITTGTTAGTGNGQLYYPESVASFSDTAQYVLAANTLNNRVEVFSNVSSALTFRSNFGSPN